MQARAGASRNSCLRVKRRVAMTVAARLRFSTAYVEVAPEDRLALSVYMAPATFFGTTRVPPATRDRVLIGVLGGAAGAVGGIPGLVVGGLLGMFGSEELETDVEVPCFNPIISARHEWTGQQLLDFGQLSSIFRAWWA